MKVWSVPEETTLVVTGKCNLRCKYCLAKDLWGVKDLSTKKMIDLIDYLGKIKVFKLNIFGGEPLVRKDLFVLLERLNRYQISLDLSTNGTLITKEVAKKLVKYNFRIFCISLDGTKASHDALRGKGSYDKTIDGIKNLVAQKANVSMFVTVTKLNMDSLEKLILLGKKLDVSSVRFNMMLYIGNAVCFKDELFISADEKRSVCEKLRKLQLKYGNFVQGPLLDLESRIREKPKNAPEERFIKINPCGAGVQKCVIRHDGWVVPCEYMWNEKAGNIKSSPLLSIWKKSKVLKDIRKPFTLDLNDLPECKVCSYKEVCFTGHRCVPYFYQEGVKNKKLYCWRKK